MSIYVNFLNFRLHWYRDILYVVFYVLWRGDCLYLALLTQNSLNFSIFSKDALALYFCRTKIFLEKKSCLIRCIALLLSSSFYIKQNTQILCILPCVSVWTIEWVQLYYLGHLFCHRHKQSAPV